MTICEHGHFYGRCTHVGCRHCTAGKDSVESQIISSNLHLANGTLISDAIHSLGFTICEWGPEPEDECEVCGEQNIQMYFRSDGHGDGDFLCLGCILEACRNRLKFKTELEHFHRHTWVSNPWGVASVDDYCLAIGDNHE